MSPPRLLLADDHAATARVLRELLETEFEVVAQVADGLALLSAVARLAPDVIVSDLSMPGMDGLTALAHLVRMDPGVRVVIVTAHSDPLLVERGMEAGALGYVTKGTAGDQLIAAVHSALRGERYVSPVP